MTRLEVVHPDGRYEVVVSSGGMASLGGEISSCAPRTRACAVVSEPGVPEAHRRAARDALARTGLRVRELLVPTGEAAKTPEQARLLWDALATDGADRDLVIVAVGGGVVGDLAGFVAATWLRGVPLVMVPTTLLAMVDSSVGGKVAVDLPSGKNLVGAFKFPELVLADPDLLVTLPPDVRAQGMAEAIKHGMLAGEPLLEKLERLGAEERVRSELLAELIAVKAGVVERDPFERGERMLLNLGHTFAHAFERASRWRLPHGEAVARGLGCAVRLAAARGLCEPAYARRVETLLERHRLPHEGLRMTGEQLVEMMRSDKKRSSTGLRLVLPGGPGRAQIVEGATAEEMQAALARA